MNDRQTLTRHFFHSLLMAAAMVAVLPMAAFAQGTGGADLGEAATNITGFLGPVAPLISGLFWLGGAVLMGAGALKLKEHAENPGNNPLRQGISRIAVGAALLTIPFFAQFAVNTLSAGNAEVGFTALTQP
ncbi:MAG: hypothetical protein AB7H77_02500 [Bdellovibrionales bacterium]